MIQKTFILDTNVYGELIVEINSSEIIKKIKSDNLVYIYGVDIIEHELHDVPTDKKIKGKVFRNAVLNIYKSLIQRIILNSERGI